MTRIETPLLIIAFNRPGELKKMIDALSVHSFRKIYAFVDGPREGIQADHPKVDKCRKMLSEIGFANEIITNFRDANLGCGKGVFSAITEVFENENELIIVEDDCITSKGFFPYCDLLLNHYRHEERVWMISGVNYSSEYRGINSDSYLFSEYGHIGAWATWKRSWDKVIFDPKSNLENLDKFVNSEFRTEKERLYFTKIFRDNFENPNYDAWGFQAFFAMAVSSGLSVVPRENLITNIGISGTHQSKKDHYNFLDRNEEYVIDTHPREITPNRAYDIYHFNTHWVKMSKRSLLMKIRNRIRRLIFRR